jgi:hypothetical protein
MVRESRIVQVQNLIEPEVLLGNSAAVSARSRSLLLPSSWYWIWSSESAHATHFWTSALEAPANVRGQMEQECVKREKRRHNMGSSTLKYAKEEYRISSIIQHSKAEPYRARCFLIGRSRTSVQIKQFVVQKHKGRLRVVFPNLWTCKETHPV